MDEEYDFGEAPDDYTPDISGAGDSSVTELSIDEIIEEAEDYTPPSDDEQNTLLSFLVNNPNLWHECKHIIDDGLFTKENKRVLKYIQKHVDKYDTVPSRSIIKTETGVNLFVEDYAKTEPGSKWFKDALVRFCRVRACQDRWIKAQEEIKENGGNDGFFETFLEDMADIKKISLEYDFGYEIHDSVKTLLERSKDDRYYTTGFEFLDLALGGELDDDGVTIINGGTTRPSVNIITADSGHGKSMFMKNIAINQCLRGESGVFYSLELPEYMVEERFVAIREEVSLGREIYGNLDAHHARMQMRKKTDGRIFIKKFEMHKTTMADLESHFQALREKHDNLQFSFVCIDYIDVMRPNDSSIDVGNIHLRDDAIIGDMKRFADKNHMVVWTGNQVTKGSGDEKKRSMGQMQGGTTKKNTADNVIIGYRTAEDKENEKWVTFVGKARAGAGTNALVPFHWDSKTQKMTDGDLGEFQEMSPFLWDKKTSKLASTGKTRVSDRIANDPIAKAMGVGVDKDKSAVRERKKESKTVLDRLTNRTSGSR